MVFLIGLREWRHDFSGAGFLGEQRLPILKCGLQSIRYANARPEARIERYSSMKEPMGRSAKIIEKSISAPLLSVRFVPPQDLIII